MGERPALVQHAHEDARGSFLQLAARRMMTRIVQRVDPDSEAPTHKHNQVYVFAKGADTSILARSIPKHMAE